MRKDTIHTQVAYLFTVIAVLVVALIFSENVSGQIEKEDKKKFSKKGADTCLKCHDEDYRADILPIFYGKHGNMNDSRTPMAQLQCESCHGPIGDHENEPMVGQKRTAMIAFGKKSHVSVEKQNDICLACHNDEHRNTWTSSAHALQSMRCVDCHVLHAANDRMQSQQAQMEKCLSCHRRAKAQFQRASAHPVRQGKIQCSQCHNPHGSFAEKLLLANNKNQLCYRCHAEKRGPVLWTHAPVVEDCGICHEHHGSNYDALLKKRPPLLCQQCHSATGHPSLAYDSSGLAKNTPNAFLLGKSCLNCHFQVHGSNHPSGVKLMR